MEKDENIVGQIFNQFDLIKWLDKECPHGTMTNDLSHDFAELLRKKLDKLQLLKQ